MARVVDLDFEAVGKPAASAPSPWFTARFNVALFAFLGVVGVGRFLLAASLAPAAIPVGSVLLDGARWVAMVLISAAFLRVFWERLVASIWPVRAIDYGEAVAILLMASLLSGA